MTDVSVMNCESSSFSKGSGTGFYNNNDTNTKNIGQELRPLTLSRINT